MSSHPLSFTGEKPRQPLIDLVMYDATYHNCDRTLAPVLGFGRKYSIVALLIVLCISPFKLALLPICRTEKMLNCKGDMTAPGLTFVTLPFKIRFMRVVDGII